MEAIKDALLAVFYGLLALVMGVIGIAWYGMLLAIPVLAFVWLVKAVF